MTEIHPKPTTDDAGIPVPSDDHSLTVGPDGPILLQDHYLIEQMANFNRERIPERQPHAKGSGAFGRFEVTHDVSEVNAPKCEVHSYSKDGAMRIRNATDPVYAPNSYGGPVADPARAAEVRWHTDGEMVRAANTLHAEDDDWGQAHTLVREVMDDAERQRLVANVAGHLLNGVSEKVLQRAFDYWRSIDKQVGDSIEAAVRNI
jgi:catalase